jgi:hypothetical protein
VESSARGYYGDLRPGAGAFTALGLRFRGFAFGALLDTHVLEFAGLEDLTAFEALDELSVFLAAHDLHARVLAWSLVCVLRMRERL